MANAPGRPSKACDVCKKQKIRCSGERPSCKRCVRLNNTCEYVTSRVHSGQKRSFTRPTGTSKSVESRFLAPVALPAHLNAESVSGHDFFQGIAPSLVTTLVELYFDNVYQSTLLLHKAIFLQSLTNQTVKPHILLSICAWGANFYRDDNRKATLKEQGLMEKWAKTAGRLVFQEAEELSDDNLVTFCNLSLFWHSQGSWRISYLHKGARTDLGFSIADFTSCEKLFGFEAITDIENLPLPWSEEDFAVGASESAVATITNGVCSAGIFAQLIRGLSLWSSVVSVVRVEGDLNLRLQEIFRIENDISSWWNSVPSRFKLDASTILNISRNDLPKIILINLVYHQSLCALHSSIVPLFCWSRGDRTYSSARQLSAQVAFDHAVAISSLISAILTTGYPLSSMPIFVAYAAYSSCAVQIPFLWCSEPSVRARAETNVDNNVKMMQGMSSYWKLASLLRLYVRCLYDVHKRNPPTVCDEPKYMDIAALVDFEVDASLARSSILQFAGMLRSDENGYVKAGDETPDPTISSNGDVLSNPQASDQAPNTNNTNTITPQTPKQLDPGPSEWPTLDIFNSLIDADMAGLFPFDDNVDLSFLDANQTSWDFGLDL
ncbi:hypothetical protein F52700_6258 [Fusarium sp. NRRL 52700]|nr:hypothetical protein F52700_6258 [Fusarium sp. NRRL 52700]